MKINLFLVAMSAVVLFGFSSCSKDNTGGSDEIPDGAVDLGLSVKWASCNLGASSPEEYGDYYAWGETQPKLEYSWESYKFGTSQSGPFSKYNVRSTYGTVDNKSVLESVDDAAHVKLGGSWRIPTNEEWTELRTKCTWTWTTQNGVEGIKVTGPNGNSIFLPAASGSKGEYWSSSLDTYQPHAAWYVFIYTSSFSESSSWRCNGLSIRPVSK